MGMARLSRSEGAMGSPHRPPQMAMQLRRRSREELLRLREEVQAS